MCQVDSVYVIILGTCSSVVERRPEEASVGGSSPLGSKCVVEPLLVSGKRRVRMQEKERT